MKLHQVIIAILMFKTLDWMMAAAIINDRVGFGDGIVIIMLWIGFWSVVWAIAESISRGRAAKQALELNRQIDAAE